MFHCRNVNCKWNYIQTCGVYVTSIQKNIWSVIRVRLESVRLLFIVVYFPFLSSVYVTISLVGVTNILNAPYIERTSVANILAALKTSAFWHPFKSVMRPLSWNYFLEKTGNFSLLVFGISYELVSLTLRVINTNDNASIFFSMKQPTFLDCENFLYLVNCLKTNYQPHR